MPGEQKRRKRKREMSEEERAQCKKGELKGDDDATRVANRQNNYNKLPASEKCVASTLVVSVDLFPLSYNQVSFCLNVWCFSPVLNRL